MLSFADSQFRLGWPGYETSAYAEKQKITSLQSSSTTKWKSSSNQKKKKKWMSYGGSGGGG